MIDFSDVINEFADEEPKVYVGSIDPNNEDLKNSNRSVKSLKHRKYRKTNSHGSPLWNFFHPQMKVGEDDSSEFLKPPVSSQLSYIQTNIWKNWSEHNLNSIYETKEKREDILKQMNDFEEIFSPLLFLHDTKEPEEIYEKLKYLKRMNTLDTIKCLETCERIKSRMMESKRKALAELDKMVDSQINKFQTSVMDKFLERKNKISSFDSKLFEEKTDRFEINFSSSTPLSTLLKECSDALLIIFDYLETKHLLCEITSSCSYFYSFVRKKYPIKLIISPRQFNEYPIPDNLKRFRIREIHIKHPKSLSSDILEISSEGNILRPLEFSSFVRDHCKEIKVLRLTDYRSIRFNLSETDLQELIKKEKQKQNKTTEDINITEENNIREIVFNGEVRRQLEESFEFISFCENLEQLQDAQILPNPILNDNYLQNLTFLELSLDIRHYQAKTIDNTGLLKKRIKILTKFISSGKGKKLKKIILAKPYCSFRGDLEDSNNQGYCSFNDTEMLEETGKLNEVICCSKNCPCLESFHLNIFIGFPTVSFEVIKFLCTKISDVKIFVPSGKKKEKEKKLTSFKFSEFDSISDLHSTVWEQEEEKKINNQEQQQKEKKFKLIRPEDIDVSNIVLSKERNVSSRISRYGEEKKKDEERVETITTTTTTDNSSSDDFGWGKSSLLEPNSFFNNNNNKEEEKEEESSVFSDFSSRFNSNNSWKNNKKSSRFGRRNKYDRYNKRKRLSGYRTWKKKLKEEEEEEKKKKSEEEEENNIQSSSEEKQKYLSDWSSSEEEKKEKKEDDDDDKWYNSWSPTTTTTTNTANFQGGGDGFDNNNNELSDWFGENKTTNLEDSEEKEKKQELTIEDKKFEYFSELSITSSIKILTNISFREKKHQHNDDTEEINFFCRLISEISSSSSSVTIILDPDEKLRYCEHSEFDDVNLNKREIINPQSTQLLNTLKFFSIKNDNNHHHQITTIKKLSFHLNFGNSTYEYSDPYHCFFQSDIFKKRFKNMMLLQMIKEIDFSIIYNDRGKSEDKNDSDDNIISGMEIVKMISKREICYFHNTIFSMMIKKLSLNLYFKKKCFVQICDLKKLLNDIKIFIISNNNNNNNNKNKELKISLYFEEIMNLKCYNNNNDVFEQPIKIKFDLVNSKDLEELFIEFKKEILFFLEQQSCYWNKVYINLKTRFFSSSSSDIKNTKNLLIDYYSKKKFIKKEKKLIFLSLQCNKIFSK